MSPSLLLSVSAIYMALVGLLYVFAPSVVLEGIEADTSAFLIAEIRISASTFIAIAVMNWMARNEGRSKALDAIFLGNFIGLVLAAVLTVLAVLAGGEFLGWIVAAINALFAVGFLVVGRSNMSS